MLQKEITDLKLTEPWIEIETRVSPKSASLDELVSNLKSIGSVHVRQVWMPAAGPTYEIWLVVKWGLGSLATIWLTGKIYDIMRMYEKKLIDALKSFFNNDVNQTELSSVSLEFDDTIIEFERIDKGNLGLISKFFNELPKHMKILTSKGITNIRKISFIVYSDEMINILEKYGITCEIMNFNDQNLKIWNISYHFGCSHALYDSENEIILE